MRGWRVGTLGGIAIEINYTWLFLFVLLTGSLSDLLKSAQGGLEPWIYYAAGAVTTLLFLASVLTHEMCHSLVARALGMRVSRITLFIFGGVSQIEEEPRTARIELLMTIVGPGSSAVLGVFFWGLSWLGSHQLGWPGLATGALQFIGKINLALAVFNLVPGFPLDGGRVLRSILWSAWQDEYRATKVAARCGMGLGGLMIALGGADLLVPGFAQMFPPWLQGGLWYLFLGWIILSAARQSAGMNEFKFMLQGLQAGQVMQWPLVSIPESMRLSDALHNLTPTGTQPLYPVVDENGKAVGVLDQQSVARVTAEQWPQLSVAQVMSPLQPETEIHAEDPVGDALQRLAGSGQGWLLVISPENKPVGLVTEQSIMAAMGRRKGK